MVSELKQKTDEEGRIVKLQNDIRNLQKASDEYQIICQEVAREETELAAVSKDTRTIEEVTVQYDELQKQRFGPNECSLAHLASEKLNAELDRLRKESQSKQEEIHSRESALHKMKEETLKIKGFGDQINKMRQQRDELLATNEKLIQDIKSFEAVAQQKTVEMQEIAAGKQKLQKEQQAKEDELAQGRDAFQQAINKLEAIHNQIQQ